MAKRVRGSTSRPGQRRPLQRRRPSDRPPSRRLRRTQVVARPDELTEAEEARAAELEAAIVAEERQAEAREAAGAHRPIGRARRRAPEFRACRSRAAEEYAYVARDVRRIVIVGGSLVLFLIALWLIAHVTGFGPF